MYTGFGATDDQIFGTWHVDANGQVSNGPLQLRAPTDPPYIPALKDLSGRRLWWTLKEIINLPANEKSSQSNFSTWDLQRLVDAGRGDDIWPIGEGPWTGRYTGGVSPWGISSGSLPAPYDDPNFVRAMQYSATRGQSTGTPMPGLPEETPFMDPRDPATIPGYPVEFGGPAPLALPPIVSQVPSADQYSIPAETIVPGVYSPPVTVLPAPADVVTPISPAQGGPTADAAEGFPVWAWVALGIGAYAILSRK